MSGPVVIRASGLPQYTDCPRRSIARAYPEMVAAAGYELRKLPPSIGAVVGTATHAVLSHYLETRVVSQEVAGAVIDEETRTGVVWDDTTRDREAAVLQANRQAVMAINKVAKDLQPVAVEKRLEADAGDGFLVRGHLDVLEPNGVLDWKTGAMQRANQAQYGGYMMLAEANGYRADIAREVFIPRAPPRRPQPVPEITVYEANECKRAAWHAIRRIKDDLIAFRESADPWALAPNPNSMMCGANYCPAHGTAFCRAHKPIKED